MIPVNEPLLTGREKALLSECIDTGWISSEGPFVKQFESEFAGSVDRSFGIAVSSGSAALDIAIASLGLKEGDQVIMPAFTIISPAASVVRAGATPVLVDSDPLTWNMDVSQIESKVTPHTKAIIVVHIYGLPVDMQPLLHIAKMHNLKVIEDAAEMHGQTYNGKPCGSFGDISTFSFYCNKLITTGEGGMIVANDEELAERCRSYRNLCFQAEKRFVHEALGWNYRMTNLQAALGLAQLEKMDEFKKIKRSMGERYTRLLTNIAGLELPLSKSEYAENIYWVFGLVLKDNVPFDAHEAMNRLKKYGIGTRPFFHPMHEQPVFRKMGLFESQSFPVSERLARRGFYIPSGLALTDEQMEAVGSAIKDVLR